MVDNLTSTLLWNAVEDDYSAALYVDFVEQRWNPNEIFLSEDKINWMKIDVKVRRDIITSILVSKIIEKTIGTILLPVLIEIVGEDFATRRAMLSCIAARINGEHAELGSKMITELNPQTLIKKSLEKVEVSDILQNTVSSLTALFQSVRGLQLAVRSGIGPHEYELFDQLNIAIWKACSVATIMIEVVNSTPTALIFEELEKHNLPNVLEAFKLSLMDRSVISSYLALIAKSKLSLVSSEEQRVARKWTTNYVKVLFTDLWIDIELMNEDKEYSKIAISEYGHYNVNKALNKLDLDTIYSQTNMPLLIQKYLLEKEEVKDQNWFKWRKD